MDRTTVLDVEGQALALLEKYDLLRIPVDVVALARKMNIQVYKASFGDEGISGAISKTSENAGKIWVNKFEGEARQRFTIAHEIGHWMLHMQAGDELSEPTHLVEWRRDDGAMSDEERAANRFAAALLMPAPLVEGARDRFDGDVSWLADLFEVSLTAMSIRLQDVSRL